MKKTGLLLGTLALLLPACSSRVTQVSNVIQGGFEPPAPPVVARPAIPAEPPAEAAPSPAADTLSEQAPVAPQAAPVVPEAATPGPVYVPSPILAEDIYPSLSEESEDEVAPAPELVGPEDEALIEKMHQGEETAAAPEVEQSPEVQYDIPMELHPRVLDYIEIFQTSRRRGFTRGLARSRIYEEIIVPILRQEGVPADLYYLALIESAFNPRAYSKARATGIWQFIYSTGKVYGLRRTHWVDQRRDPEKATRAAARHLRDLHNELGSWPLALAAYNAGINRVKRDIRKAGTRDFWKLRLPAQTRNYVPAFFAALIIAKEPERYGFHVVYEDPVVYDTVEVDGGTRLSLVASFCSTSLQKIRDLNPEIRQGCAPPGGKYTLNIPPGKTEEVVAGLARTPKPKITGWGSYTIHSGDTLSSIARDFGTTVEAIQEVNNLPGHFIRAGDRLVIPNAGVASGSIPVVREARISIPPTGTYRVRRGDSLWSISRRFGVSLEELTSLNGIGSRHILQIGQVLRLRPSGQPTAVALSDSGGTSFYRVRKGDSFWSISRRFNTDIKSILRANRMSRGQTIYPGEQLIIPGGKL
jgi:membrane-bound lytic murein transglycosylase D